MMQIKVSVRGMDKVKKFLKDAPKGTVKIAMLAIGEYMLGDGSKGFRKYPPYKHVTRRRAYGSTFVSDKQRKYVMARIREGTIDPGYPHRTGRTQRAYKLQIKRGGYDVSIVNDEPGAYFTAHDEGQARLNALVGWRKAADIVRSNINGALRHANAKTREYLKGK